MPTGYGIAFRPAARIFTYFPFFWPVSDPKASVAYLDAAPQPAGRFQAITEWTATAKSW
jgi:hypothetical protein